MPERRVQISFRVPEDHPCLAGHFPGRPLVPAVLLLEQAAEALRPSFSGRAPCGVTAAKFTHPLQPGEAAALLLDADPERGRARFRCMVADRLIARGELIFADDAHAA